MPRYYYKNSVADFSLENPQAILGQLVNRHEFNLEEQQRNAWNIQIQLLQRELNQSTGTIIFEYSIPRMGKRIDAVLLSDGIIFAIEFKVGADKYEAHAIDQVIDYALDLKNFHEQSHNKPIIPILICTHAKDQKLDLHFDSDDVAAPILVHGKSLDKIINIISSNRSHPMIDTELWCNSIYKPTPTIIEAAQALYRGHTVEEISRSDAGAINLSQTASAISQIIDQSKQYSYKSICFLTGVPGAGKTLAGLNLANTWHNEDDSEHAVFLSGNGPLVEVLRTALMRNERESAKEHGEKVKASLIESKTKAFIQNIHHFRDDALQSPRAPIEKVVVFDEAQRAWTLEQTSKFMKTKKGKSDFNQSEPEFLISVLDRHSDWATIVCLIGGGQEINTGEAGLHEWFDALKRSFPHWKIFVSNQLSDHEYTLGRPLFSEEDVNKGNLHFNKDLHLSVSIRSYRSERVAAFVKSVLDLNVETASKLYMEIHKQYPIFLTRDLNIARNWLRTQARGTERYGLVASSGAIRLKPYGINVKASIDPSYWFLNKKSDIRSSYFLEDVATEFDIQGLELDWACVAWDADLRLKNEMWSFKSFRGTNWQDVKQDDAKLYLLNSYRVLLTRARQGMVIFIPPGDSTDATRQPEFYDSTFAYLLNIGMQVL